MLFGSKGRTICAVEIGTSKVAVAVAQLRPKENLRILGLGITPSVGLRKGEVIDKNQAKQALREAILKAEENSGETIEEVFLALNGAHLQGINRRSKIAINGQKGFVSHEDVDALKKIAEDFPLPPDRLRVLTLPRGYRIDGGELIQHPVGLAGNKVEGNYMIVHGIESRLTNIISLVNELNIEIKNYTLSAIASAEAVLSEEERQLGALVIDFGGGLTSCCLYLNGYLEDICVIGVGGDHITYDLARAFSIPTRVAEELKVKYGCVVVRTSQRDQIIHLKPNASFPGKKVYLECVAEIIRLRVEEIFDILMERIGQQRFAQIGTGIFLTGGSSKISGIDFLAEVKFGKHTKVVSFQELNGVTEGFSQPELSVVFGTLLHAKKLIESEQQRKSFVNPWKRIFVR